MLEAIGAGVGGKTNIDWVTVWRSSPEAQAVLAELEEQKNKPAAHTGKPPQVNHC
jgi:hypothetical protein